MMTPEQTLSRFFKPFFFALCLSCIVILSACSTNPATGKSQFTGLMSPAQETKVGASEHKKIMAQFGAYENRGVQNYVSEIGRRVTAKTERPDVRYQFFVLDSPIVNAFALPGGYIYVSRGLLALANNEAELAAVLAHETGHITARHSAERYSHGVLTTLGAGLLSAALDSSGATQALSLGSNLYLSSYSRSQENESDTLGLRYMSHAGYDTQAMSSFLASLQNESTLQSQMNGKSGSGFSYFSTHPATADRVAKTRGEAGQYGQGGTVNRDAYLNVIDGMTYGDSEKQGFARGQDFYHPVIGFTFSVPQGFRLINQPSQVVATSDTGAVMLYDMVGNKNKLDPVSFLTKTWMKDQKLNNVESIKVGGMPAATAAFNGQVNGKAVTIRIMAIRWSDGTMARFQIAIPRNAPSGLVEALKSSSYSLRRLSDKEKQDLKPYRLRVITARAGDTVNSLARRQPFDKLQAEQFRVLNGLGPAEQVQAGRRYKIVAD